MQAHLARTAWMLGGIRFTGARRHFASRDEVVLRRRKFSRYEKSFFPM
ncbi:MAG: hypothetical protein ACXWC6_08410 [Ramlibacter sp.]